MGGYTSKHESSTKRSIKGKSKEQRSRVTNREVDEKEGVIVAIKMAETEWRKERKKLREEVKRLRMKMEEKEEAKVTQHECEWVVEQMCLVRAVREEAVERWKQLYFAIKNELDDLIHTTYGEALRQKPQEEEDTQRQWKNSRRKLKLGKKPLRTSRGE